MAVNRGTTPSYYTRLGQELDSESQNVLQRDVMG